MEQAYSALSKVYEYLICDCDYEKWSQYLLNCLKNCGVKSGSKGIDCACGSGFFTRALKRGGYDVTGVDFSREMLDEALRNSAKEGLKIQYLLMDMASLKTFEKVDFITVINDGINYVSPEKLPKMFKSFHSALKSGGTLLFDFSSEYKIKNILGNNLFGEDDENCSYLWFNKQGDGYVDMDIVLFLKNGETYVKREEEHRQFAHKTEFIVDLLQKCGFVVASVTEYLGAPVCATSERIEIIAKKG